MNFKSLTTGEQNDIQDEIDLENYLANDIGQVIDLTGDEPEIPSPITYAGSSKRRTVGSVRERELPAWTLPDGIVLRPGITFEILYPDPHGIKFFKIQHIIERQYQDGHSDVILRGWGFMRTRELHGELPRKRNELVLLCNMLNGCSDPWERQALTDVPLSMVGMIREIRITNKPFLECRFDMDDLVIHGKFWVEEHSLLVCRWRREAWHNPGKKVPTETALIRITENEADPSFRGKDSHLLNQWRGGKVPGGSYPLHLVVDLEMDGTAQTKLQPGQKYTAGDVFAGAGGASRGIERAGVHLLFSLDHWTPAADSLRMNFSHTDIYECEVTDFIKDKSIRYCPDILHLSPPCQFWSPAHTTPGKDDEKNVDVLFSCEHLINKLRPRLFTVEQTFGIVHARFAQYFATLIQGFTKHGYSVRWKVVVLANYGVPQTRKRLIMIGAAPGEKLPPFPPPTHSQNGMGGLPRWVTPKAILDRVEHITPEDNKLHVKKRFPSPKPPWDPYALAKTITCGGGQNYHWNGRRDFTKLEYAVLQGFPTWHKFSDVAVKKQIGNAFAPSVVRHFYQHLVKWLLVQDGLAKEADAIKVPVVYLRTEGVTAAPAPGKIKSPIISHPGERMEIDEDEDDDLWDSSSSRATFGDYEEEDEEEGGVI
ncbi:S-adenosyl-L-methionine-dependent methyltransferase [Podospora fimiseda]|uniref:DNA (cytosine-5-)-methyltransferase n=1 Tax=Podospora fimiseda TaxID=252190 RepID=A0AAN7BZ96_9PEZI|nr:S-adenosyl-L-methionine-dependent methyltransferase [Podospora fimiseda]